MWQSNTMFRVNATRLPLITDGLQTDANINSSPPPCSVVFS